MCGGFYYHYCSGINSKFLFIGFLFGSSLWEASVCLCYIWFLHEFYCIFSFESYRILSYVRNPMLVLSDSVCCTVESSVPNQHRQSSLQCLYLHANEVLISLWGKQRILLLIVPFLLSKLRYSLVQVNFDKFPICWTLSVWDQYTWNIS